MIIKLRSIKNRPGACPKCGFLGLSSNEPWKAEYIPFLTEFLTNIVKLTCTNCGYYYYARALDDE